MMSLSQLEQTINEARSKNHPTGIALGPNAYAEILCLCAMTQMLRVEDLSKMSQLSTFSGLPVYATQEEGIRILYDNPMKDLQEKEDTK